MESVCRACLRSPNKLLPLSDNYSLVQKIESISSIQISANEYYPSAICEECVNNVNKFFCFRKVIINSDKELKERYATLKRTNFTTKPRTKEKEANKSYSAVKEESELDQHEDILKEDENSFEDIEDVEIDDSAKDNENDLTDSNVDSIKKSIAKLKVSKCDECNLTFTSRLKLYNHRRNVHIAPGVCNICGLVVRADNLKRHVQMHSEGPVACKICDKVFKNPESLRGHLLIHKGLLFTCEICGKTSRVKSEHHRHMKTHIDPEARKIMCTVCGKRVRDLKKAYTKSYRGTSTYLFLL
ncbi:hypothetical protein NQ314_021185 [Rhamnusium bicolor]|uniref:Uncharacterized protein n=1 Tax=Rhamnusium bicolor TaxID=1586634 RepID=A0AAV8WIK7_9CUCU|nr:hypothetical protein NQ314_021185 [Rhamnusium bicolor]